MNNKLKKIFLNGLIYGIVFFALSFLIGYYYTSNVPLCKTLMMSTLIGILALIINGIIYSRFTKSLKKLQAIAITLQDFETLKLQAPANYSVNDHLISGKLFLTDKMLIFKSYNLEEYSWSLANLNTFVFHPSIFNTGGEFILLNNNDNKLIFEVDEIRLWKKALLNN